MHKRFLHGFIIYIAYIAAAAPQLFAAETVRFQEQTYSGSVTYNEKAQPGDAVFARLLIKHSSTVRSNAVQNPAAVLQLFNEKKEYCFHAVFLDKS